MATKKLKLEVELDTAKAKRQKKELEAESPSSGASVSSASPSMERASRQIKGLGESAQATGINMKAAGKAFAGMAVGLAAGYAAKNMKPGGARDAVEYGGAAVGGAAMGMMFGPIGAAIGGLVGVMKTYFDKQGDVKLATEDFQKSEDDYESARLFQSKMRKLSEVEPAAVGLTKEEANADQRKKVEERLETVKAEAVKLFEEQNKIIAETNQLLKNGQKDEAEKKQIELATVRQRKEQMESLERSYERQKKSLDREAEELKLNAKGDPRASMTGTDALAKVGGTAYLSSVASPQAEPSAPVRAAGFSFGFSNSKKVATMSFGGPSSGDSVDKAIQTATERSAKLDQEMVDTLKLIAENTKGGETWQ